MIKDLNNYNFFINKKRLFEKVFKRNIKLLNVTTNKPKNFVI